VDLDLTRAGDRRALLGFLNAWGCRNLAVAWHDLADEVLERWCEETRARLAALAGSPVMLDAASRHNLAEAFDELAGSIAAHKTRDGRELLISFGPTSTSKTLFILCPELFPAWDGPIRDALGYRGDGESYAQFTADVHAKIAESVAASRQGAALFERLPQLLGRSPYTTLAQLVVEYYWITLTRRVRLRSRDEVSRWLSW
jgi:hypothetical protein